MHSAIPELIFLYLNKSSDSINGSVCVDDMLMITIMLNGNRTGSISWCTSGPIQSRNCHVNCHVTYAAFCWSSCNTHSHDVPESNSWHYFLISYYNLLFFCWIEIFFCLSYCHQTVKWLKLWSLCSQASPVQRLHAWTCWVYQLFIFLCTASTAGICSLLR